MEVTDDGMTFAFPHRQSFVRWQAFTRLVETRRLFLLFTGRDEPVATISKASFPTPAELDEFRRLVNTHLTSPSLGFPVIVGPTK